MKIFELEPGSPEPKLINEIGSLLKKGGVIAYPTDTVYGLGGDAFNYDVHHRVRTLKGRGGNKPFPFIIDKADRLPEWGIQLNAIASALTQRFWPGPLSIIVEDAGALPSDVLGARRTMCVRLPASKIARAIAGSVGGLLIATSANPAGGKPAQSARVAADFFKGEIDAVVDGGPSPSALPSTIVDVTGRKMVLLREGSVPSEQLLQVVSDIERDTYFGEGNGS
jgi:L-threonylcarbamoyladenylate synthase